MTRLMATGALGLALLACQEEAKTPPAPYVTPPQEDFVLEDFEPALTDGHWKKDQRGVPLDDEDMAVVQEDEGPAGVSVGQLSTAFGVLVLNLPYLDYLAGAAGSNPCVDRDDAPAARPLARAEAFIDALETEKGLAFEAVAVNVDLMNPQRNKLYYQCQDSPPKFGNASHRASLVEAFVELASLPHIKFITVGMELNRYSEFRNADGEDMPEEYVNLITLYREIYARVHDVAPDVKVGPSFSWDYLMNTTAIEVANEIDVSDFAGVEAWYASWKRTVLPFLFAAGAPGQPPNTSSADFVAFTMFPETSIQPFNGDPAAADAEAAADVERYYRYLAFAGSVAMGPPEGQPQLPVAFPQIDWPVSSSGFSKQKDAFVQTFKRAVSHVDVAFVAWRRLSDLPTRVEGQKSPCDRVMEGQGFDKQYCNSGMISASGSVRDVFDLFTTNP